MTSPNQIVTAQTTATLEVQTIGELLILSSPAIQLPKLPCSVLILGYFAFTLAAGGGQAIKPRIRRGTTLASTVVGTVLNQPLTASSTFWSYTSAVDIFTTAAEPRYSLTLENTAAAANALVKGASIMVLTL